jgi:hypothetical protein
MASMPRALRTVAVLILVALMPIRAVAAVTIGFCAAGQQEAAVPSHAEHGHDAQVHAHHGGDQPPAKPATPSCRTCVEHCSGVAFAPSMAQFVDAGPVAQERVYLAERIAPAFVLDQLDRPPLA